MLASLIGSMASGEISELFSRLRRAVIIYVLAAIAIVCGAGFLLAAGYMAAERHYGPIAAALGFGVGFILFAVLLLAIYAAVHAARRVKRRKKKHKAELSGMMGAAALAVLPSLLRSRMSLFGLLAPVAALAAYEIYKENTGSASRAEKDGYEEE